MSALTTRTRARQLALVGDGPERLRREDRDCDRPRRESARCAGGDRLTLEQRLDRVWEGLLAAGVAECPVCAARMQRASDGRAGVCGGCGSSVS